MATLYVTEKADEQGNDWAYARKDVAKQDANGAHKRDGGVHRVLKVELNNDLGIRDLMCALFNGESDKYTKSKVVIYTAPAKRGRKAKDDEGSDIEAGEIEQAIAAEEEDLSDL